MSDKRDIRVDKMLHEKMPRPSKVGVGNGNIVYYFAEQGADVGERFIASEARIHGAFADYLTRTETAERRVAELEARFTCHSVCLCGSTRFYKAFRDFNKRLTLQGAIVLTIGCEYHNDTELGITDEQKAQLDDLHKRKIDLADEILVLDVGGYIGSSTRGEIEYAGAHDKPVRYLSKEFPGYVEPVDVVEAERGHARRMVEAAIDVLYAECDRCPIYVPYGRVTCDCRTRLRDYLDQLAKEKEAEKRG